MSNYRLEYLLESIRFSELYQTFTLCLLMLQEAGIQALQMLAPNNDGASCSEEVRKAIQVILAATQKFASDEHIFAVSCQVSLHR